MNCANKIKNLVTELEFELRENDEEYFIIIRSSGAQHGLRLAFSYKDQHQWTLFENEIYTDFYKYMFKKIITLDIQNKQCINTVLTDWLLRLWIV